MKVLADMLPYIMVKMSVMTPAITEAGIYSLKSILVAGMPRSHPPAHRLPLEPHRLHRVLVVRVVAGGLVRVQAAPRDGEAKEPKIFARLRRAGCLCVRARELAACIHSAARRRKVYSQHACTWSPPAKWTFLGSWYQSIDLDEPYPTVRVSQIVTRRKYFFAAVEDVAALEHVHPYSVVERISSASVLARCRVVCTSLKRQAETDVLWEKQCRQEGLQRNGSARPSSRTYCSWRQTWLDAFS